MLYGLLADLTALLHLAFIVFVLLGGIAVLRYPRLVLLHVPAALWGLLIELFGWYCPLTPLENLFLRKAGEEGYSVGFIEHYLLPLLYPAWLTAETRYVLAAVVLVLNAAVYGAVVSRRRRK